MPGFSICTVAIANRQSEWAEVGIGVCQFIYKEGL